MLFQSKIQYKAFSYPGSSNTGVSLLKLKIWDLSKEKTGDWGVETSSGVSGDSDREAVNFLTFTG